MSALDAEFDRCPACGGEPESLGIWATQFMLRCRGCGLTYRNREHELALLMDKVRDNNKRVPGHYWSKVGGGR